MVLSELGQHEMARVHATNALRLIEEVQFPSEAELAARCSSIMHLPAAPRYFGLLMATLGAQSMAVNKFVALQSYFATHNDSHARRKRDVHTHPRNAHRHDAYTTAERAPACARAS